MVSIDLVSVCFTLKEENQNPKLRAVGTSELDFFRELHIIFLLFHFLPF